MRARLAEWFRLVFWHSSQFMHHGSARIDRPNSAPTAMVGRGAAARIARRLAAMLRRGARLTLRDGLAASAAGAPPASGDLPGAMSTAAPAVVVAPAGHGAARAPRPVRRPAAARRPAGKPGRGRRPRAGRTDPGHHGPARLTGGCLTLASFALPRHRAAGFSASQPTRRAAGAFAS
jgi:hypothetical protein